ncbi:MAG TPA: hypothetical protein VGK93_00405 [Candidatus Eisenbacteria bacterium]
MPFASEDAYITFRYARHLANGHGLVYNRGQRVFGFSSPLWTFWIALGFRLTHDAVLWARLTNLMADLTILLVMGTLLSRHVSRATAWCFSVFYAAWPYFTAVSVSSMECTSMLALIAVAATAASRASAGTGPALAAVALMRPEGIASAMVLAFAARRRDRLVATGIFAAVVAGLTLYYGSPVPQSLVAKSLLYGMPGPWVGRHWWEWLSPVPLGRGAGSATPNTCSSSERSRRPPSSSAPGRSGRSGPVRWQSWPRRVSWCGWAMRCSAWPTSGGTC